MAVPGSSFVRRQSISKFSLALCRSAVTVRRAAIALPNWEETETM